MERWMDWIAQIWSYASKEIIKRFVDIFVLFDEFMSDAFRFDEFMPDAFLFDVFMFDAFSFDVFEL